MTFPTDLAIARQAKLRPLADIAAQMGIRPELLEAYGAGAAKVSLHAIDEPTGRARSTS